MIAQADAGGVTGAREALPVATSSAVAARDALPPAGGTLVPLLVWSAVGEFVLLRTFLRLGPLLPVSEPFLATYRALALAGVAALNLALLSAAGLVAVLLGRLVMSRAAPTDVARGPALRIGRAGLVALALIVCAQVLAVYHPLAQAAAGWGLTLPGQGTAVLAAEALAVAAALALPWSYRPPSIRWRRRHVVLGGGLGLVLLAALMARPWTVATLAMWTVGFTLFLPGIVYAAALASAAAAAGALCGAGERGRAVAAGLLLVAVAGLRLDSTYTAALAVAGTLLLVDSTVRLAGRTVVRTPEPGQ